MHFMESREKRGPQVHPRAVCCSMLPEGQGPEAGRAATSACCCQRQFGTTALGLSGLVKEEEGKGGYEKQERREAAPGVWGEQAGWPHQEEFWFW